MIGRQIRIGKTDNITNLEKIQSDAVQREKRWSRRDDLQYNEEGEVWSNIGSILPYPILLFSTFLPDAKQAGLVIITLLSKVKRKGTWKQSPAF